MMYLNWLLYDREMTLNYSRKFHVSDDVHHPHAGEDAPTKREHPHG